MGRCDGRCDGQHRRALGRGDTTEDVMVSIDEHWDGGDVTER